MNDGLGNYIDCIFMIKNDYLAANEPTNVEELLSFRMVA